MASVLERMRTLHEDIEALEKAAVACYENKPKAVAPALLCELKAAAYVRRIQQLSAALQDLYNDKDGSKKAEIGACTLNAQDGIMTFYQQLSEMQKSRHPASSVSEDAVAFGDIPMAPDALHADSTAPGTTDSATASSGVLSGPDAAAEVVLSRFTGEELYGRYVDTHGFFSEWTNLPGIKDVRVAVASGESVDTAIEAQGMTGYTYAMAEHTAWLKKLTDVHVKLPSKVKTTRAYRKYISGIVSYFTSFISRTHPAIDIGEVLEEYFQAFAAAWKAQSLPGWTATASDGSAATDEPTVDIASFASPEAILEALGAEGCKTQLKVRGLKVGGTPAERAARLWQIRGLSADKYPKKLLAGDATAPVSSNGKAQTAQIQRKVRSLDVFVCVETVDPVLFCYHRLERLGLPPASTHQEDEVVTPAGGLLLAPAPIGSGEAGTAAAAWCEYLLIQIAADLISDVVENTRRRLERRATKTREEVESERVAEEEEAMYGPPGAVDADALDDDDDEAPIYNPLNIPLDWDGKPIPVWLYKLHQLNIEYKCEICNANYMGRRDFDRHFQEWRHAYGMRSLGIPNTKHFHDIVRIEDARNLWARLQSQMQHEGWKADADEEFEDSMGNVLNRRTYEDLARHGLL